jgi:hypothetical protein
MIVELDTLLPRIVQLATRKGDRQTKALAAESLHAIVLYMVSMTTCLSHALADVLYTCQQLCACHVKALSTLKRKLADAPSLAAYAV